MNLAIALPLLLALAVAFYAVRRIAQRRVLRRQKERRARNEKTGPRSFAPVQSKRSSMRSDDDPTTVMERITVSKAPATGPGTKPK
jgi:flagellar biosynthesis/type III secretory pathway M-ring protein FliF/YscJ